MEAVPDWVGGYVGIPYQTHGRDRAGCDCWGLIALVMRERFDRHLPDYPGLDWYQGQDARLVGADAAAYASRFQTVEPGSEVSGDAILIRMRGAPLHVGLVITPGVMLHSHEDADSCVESYRTATWERRILGFYRYEGN